MAEKKLYELTDEHRAQLTPWADRWIANALKTGGYAEGYEEEMYASLDGLYRAADLEAPPHERGVVCGSPVASAMAAAISSGVWWLRENPEKCRELFGTYLTDFELDVAARLAVEMTMGDSPVSCQGAVTAVTMRLPAEREAAAAKPAPSAGRKAKPVPETDTPVMEQVRRHAIAVMAEQVTPAPSVDDASAMVNGAMAYADDVLEAGRFLVGCTQHWSKFWNGGNQWSAWVSFLSFFRHVAKLDLDYSKWDFYERAAAFGPRYMHEKFWILSMLPEYIKQDTENRPHCEDGPFCRWPDGLELFYWHGVEIPGEWVTDKANLKVETALTWANVEQRRCAAEILTWARVLEELPHRVIDVDDDPQIGSVIEVDLPDSPKQRFLKAVCGTGRTFAMPVPPETKRALEAQAVLHRVPESIIRAIEHRT